jgi:hypothetical protein
MVHNQAMEHSGVEVGLAEKHIIIWWNLLAAKSASGLIHLQPIRKLSIPSKVLWILKSRDIHVCMVSRLPVYWHGTLEDTI